MASRVFGKTSHPLFGRPRAALGRGLIRAGQLYTLVIGRRPFQWLWDMDCLVAQMIHFVEDLPSEWRPEWARMKKSAGRDWSDIPGMINFPPMYFTRELPNMQLP